MNEGHQRHIPPAYLRRRDTDKTYLGATTVGADAGAFVVEYSQVVFTLEDLAAHAIWVPVADGEALPRDVADAAIARLWAQRRALEYGCQRMVTARALPRQPLAWFAREERSDGEAGPIEPVEYVSVRFLPYAGEWSQADPADVAATLTDGRAERATTAAKEGPDLEIQIPLPEVMYADVAQRVATGTAPLTGAVILSMRQLLPAAPTDACHGNPASVGDTIVLAAAAGKPETSLVSLSLHGPGALSPHTAGSFWPRPPPTEDHVCPEK